MSVARVSWLKLHWIILAAAALGAGMVLFVFDPAQVGFYPICIFRRMTGLLCPGCGGLRAAHQLVHGNIAAAFRLNALLVLSLPLLGWLAARMLIRCQKHEPLGFEMRPIWVCAGVFVLVLFGVLRNMIRI
jgi:hypothetical protein